MWAKTMVTLLITLLLTSHEPQGRVSQGFIGWVFQVFMRLHRLQEGLRGFQDFSKRP